MVYFEKSQPAPLCLKAEKAKANGDYKCGDVLERLESDFKKKCYICERKQPSSINVEHFVAHQGNKDLKFDWNNLFWACSHCNNIKLAKYNNLLNCTILTDYVENKLSYYMKPYPGEMVKIEAIDKSSKTLQTKQLLLEVYNGTTILKKLESAGLRDAILKEISSFGTALENYFEDTNTSEDKVYFLIKVKGHLSRASSFTAFKRWIVKENDKLCTEFEQYFD